LEYFFVKYVEYVEYVEYVNYGGIFGIAFSGPKFVGLAPIFGNLMTLLLLNW